MLTQREKSPLLEKISEEDQTHKTASSKTVSPTDYQLSYSGPDFGILGLDVELEEEEKNLPYDSE